MADYAGVSSLVNQNDFTEENIQFVKNKIHCSILEAEVANRRFLDYSDEIFVNVSKRRELILKCENKRYRIDKPPTETLKSKIIDLEIQNKPEDFPKPGTYDATFAFLEGGPNDLETNYGNHFEVKMAMHKFRDLINTSYFEFKSRPLGPMYSQVFIKNEKWAALTEHVLGKYLFTFVVNNDHDEELLLRLVESFEDLYGEQIGSEIPSPIIKRIDFIKKFKPLEERISEVTGMECESINMMDAFAFRFEDVMNVWQVFLNDVVDVQRLVLVKSEHDAFLLMHDQRKVPPSQHLVKMAYSLDGFQIFPFPKFKTSLIQLPPQARYIKIYMDDKINSLKETLQSHKTEIQDISIANEKLRGCQIQAMNRFDVCKATRKYYEQKEKTFNQEILDNNNNDVQ